MTRRICLAVAALLAASLAYAAPAAPAPASSAAPAAAPAAPAAAAAVAVAPAPAVKVADLSAYVPSGALLASRLRVAQLAGSDLWKKFKGPDGAAYQKMMQDCPINMDLEKDVTEAVVAVAVTFEGNEPQKPSVGFVLAMNRDVDPTNFFKKAPPDKIQLPGASVPAYRADADTFFALPSPRTVVIASTPDFLAEMLTSAAAPAGAGKSAWLKTLDQPGELVLVARMPDEAREAMKNTLLKARQQMGSRAPPPEMIAFTAAGGFAMRMAMEFQSVALSLDLSRQADALRITFAFASENGAAFIGSFLSLLEPSVTEALAMMQDPPAPGGTPVPPGGAPAAAPAPASAPPEPVYRAVFQGKEARVTMTGATLDRIIGTVAGLISAGKQPPDRPPFPMPDEGPDEE
jgi:hypothetical protein